MFFLSRCLFFVSEVFFVVFSASCLFLFVVVPGTVLSMIVFLVVKLHFFTIIVFRLARLFDPGRP